MTSRTTGDMATMHEFILGGQRSGKSRCAESRAAAWLAHEGRSAVLIATALASDDEMRARIERHRSDRARRVPRLAAIEVPLDLAGAVSSNAAPHRLVLIDCLSLWLTNLLMPMGGAGSAGDAGIAGSAGSAALDDASLAAACNGLCDALDAASGPVVLVSNEIGLGVSPITAEARRFVDELGRLHQAVAARCAKVTWMVAGIEVPVKRASA